MERTSAGNPHDALSDDELREDIGRRLVRIEALVEQATLMVTERIETLQAEVEELKRWREVVSTWLRMTASIGGALTDGLDLPCVGGLEGHLLGPRPTPSCDGRAGLKQ